MFGFRKLAYTLLSRHFWVGIGVGFFCASLFFATQAHADTTLYTDSSFSNGSVFNSFSVDAGTTTVRLTLTQDIFASSSATYINRIKLLVSAFGDETVSTTIKSSTGADLVTGRSCVVESSTSWYCDYNDNEITASNCGVSGCSVYITSSKNFGLWRKSNPDLSYWKRTSNSQTPSGYINGSSTPLEPQDTQLLNYSFTLGNVASTSCVGSSTSSICTHYYYPNFTPATPLNLFVLYITFLVSFVGTAFIIRKLT